MSPKTFLWHLQHSPPLPTPPPISSSSRHHPYPHTRSHSTHAPLSSRISQAGGGWVAPQGKKKLSLCGRWRRGERKRFGGDKRRKRKRGRDYCFLRMMTIFFLRPQLHSPQSKSGLSFLLAVLAALDDSCNLWKPSHPLGKSVSVQPCSEYRTCARARPTFGP